MFCKSVIKYSEEEVLVNLKDLRARSVLHLSSNFLTQKLFFNFQSKNLFGNPFSKKKKLENSSKTSPIFKNKTIQFLLIFP